jgi:Capsular polysaccharide biosynthesis protein
MMDQENLVKNRHEDYAIRLLGGKNFYPWLLVFVFMLGGAGIGGLLSLALPPVYEARALVSTNLELTQDAFITEIMLDAEINHIGELVFHPDIVDAVIAKEAGEGNSLTYDQLKKNTSVERQLMNTVIKVRDKNPHVAARIASEWAEILFTRLSEAYQHAVVLSGAKEQYNAIRGCLTANPRAPQEYCRSLTAEEARVELERLVPIIIAESPHSLGLTVALNVSQYQPAALPEKPLYYSRGSLILGGALAGLVSGLVIAEFHPKFKHSDEN